MRRPRNLIALAALVVLLALALPTPAAAGPDDTLSNIPMPGSTGVHGVRVHTNQTFMNLTIRNFLRFFFGVTFVNLNHLAINGVMVYCENCTIANPCASGGTGAIAKYLNNVWVCN